MFGRRKEPESIRVDTEAGYPDPPWVVPLKNFEFVDPYSPKKGVWAVYLYDVGPVVKQVMPYPIQAIEALEHGDHIAWWPFGTELNDAIKKWDEHCLEVSKSELDRAYEEVIGDDEPSS